MAEQHDPLQDYERAKREAAARSRQSLIGHDFAEVCRLTAIELERDREAMLARQRVDAERTQYEGRHVYRCRVEQTAGGTWQAVTLEHPPLVGQLKARGRNPQHAVKELRFAYAYSLHHMKLLPDMADARAYALKADFIQELCL